MSLGDSGYRSRNRQRERKQSRCDLIRIGEAQILRDSDVETLNSIYSQETILK